MTDPPRRPPAEAPGEMRSASPPLPGARVRPPPVQRRLIRLSQPALLGIVLGSFAAGLAAFLLLGGVVGFLSTRQAALDAPENEDEEARGFAELHELALMEQQDGPLSHELNMWLLAADLAGKGYHLGGDDKRVPKTPRGLTPVMVGVQVLHSPDSRPFIRTWKLQSVDNRFAARGVVCIHLPDGHYSSRMEGASSSEWNTALYGLRLPRQVWLVGSDLIDEASWIYWTDNGKDTWDGPQGKSYKVVERSTGSEPDRRYHLILTEEVGPYHLKLVLLDALGEQPGYSQLELWFTYSPAEDSAAAKPAGISPLPASTG